MLEFNPKITANSNVVPLLGDGDEETKNTGSNKNIEIKFGDGKDVQGKDNKPSINPFAGDVANFANFGQKGYEAHSKTTVATGEVERALRDSKKKNVELPAAPDPAKYGEDDKGYENYLTALGTWQQNCMNAIKNAKSTSHSGTTKPITPKPVEPTPVEPEPVTPEPVTPEPETIRINEHFNAAEVRAASHGPGTNESRFIKAVTYGPYDVTNYKEILKRKPLNKAEVKALDEEIRNQTAGEKSLLKLMEEEFNIQGGLFRSNNKISKLYDLYSEYLSDDSDEVG